MVKMKDLSPEQQLLYQRIMAYDYRENIQAQQQRFERGLEQLLAYWRRLGWGDKF
jgi:hypothetical protein